jgi:glycosyltransferase involved in cell wall biosynthesis
MDRTKKPMRIGINLTDFIPGKMGGVETYIRNLLFHLQQVDSENTYVLLCDPAMEKEFSLFNRNFSFAHVSCPHSSIKGIVRGVLRHRFKIDLFKMAIDRLQLDVIHHAFSKIIAPPLKAPEVLSFHDMQQEFCPQFFSSEELKHRQATYRPSVERAARIIASSEHVKGCLVERYGVDPEKVDVAYLSCGPEYVVIEDEHCLRNISLKYGLDKPFLYYPAATWPHKNHKTLLHALKILKEKYRFEGLLVLSGMSQQTHAEIHRSIDALGLQDAVRILGYLPFEELPYLYNLARLLVFPSLFEGFGIPLVEAMACGCPVVCSDVTSIPEVVGGVGVLFNPESSEDIADKLAKVWWDNDLIEQLRAAGLERAKLFSGEKTALKTVQTYKKTLRQ